MLTKTSHKFLSLLFVSVLLFSFTKPVYQANFSGTWALNEGKSDLGQFGARLAATKIVIDQKADGVTTTKTVNGQNGEATITETLTNDGKEVETALSANAKKRSTLKWGADGNTFAVSYTLSFGQGEFKGSEDWSMSADGKTMTIKTTVNFNGNDVVTSAVYDKK